MQVYEEIGANAPIQGEAMRSLKINEIFYSIQGESTHAGRPCVFVRISGCPLRCTYCDTEYAFFEGEQKSFEEILGIIADFGCNLVEVTGGEPLAHKNTIALLQELESKGYELLLETSGAFSIKDVPKSVKIILDIKTPGSGESRRNFLENLNLIKPGQDEVKFVVCSKEDFEFALSICEDTKLFDKSTVLMSASWGQVSMKDLAEWVLASKKPFRLQTQLHKHIWGASERGV